MISRSITVSYSHTPTTMVIYWSIKTAIDTIAYGMGKTDEVKGTGVFRSFELKREKEKTEEKKEEEEKDTMTSTKDEEGVTKK